MINDKPGVRMDKRHFFKLIQVLLTASRGSHPCSVASGERTLADCIRYRHIGPLSGMMVCCDIGYTSRLPLLRIDDPLNSAHYISGVLRPLALPFIRMCSPECPILLNVVGEKCHPMSGSGLFAIRTIYQPSFAIVYLKRPPKTYLTDVPVFWKAF
ncbi:hypothetical protein TNCV_1619541 [Trichonephila clavipes]|nr:hypothetical protein TNCV_1619541 [Trichonephila clavipes]